LLFLDVQTKRQNNASAFKHSLFRINNLEIDTEWYRHIDIGSYTAEDCDKKYVVCLESKILSHDPLRNVAGKSSSSVTDNNGWSIHLHTSYATRSPEANEKRTTIIPQPITKIPKILTFKRRLVRILIIWKV
jgi:hypothetical protein